MYKHRRIVVFALIVILCTPFFSVPARGASSVARNYAGLVESIYDNISVGTSSFTIFYSGGALSDSLIDAAMRDAISSSASTLFSVYSCSYKFDSSSVSFIFSYVRPNNFEYIFVPDSDELLIALVRAIAQQKAGLNVYFEDSVYRNDVAYMRTQMIRLYEQAVVTCYNDYTAYLIDENRITISSTSAISSRTGGYRVTFEFLYHDTASQSAAVDLFAKEQTAKLISASMDDRAKVLAINNFIRDFAVYQETGAKKDHSPYWFITNKSGVCQGYALLASKMLTHAGVQNRIATGTVTIPHSDLTGPHIWNVVNISGDWLHLDVTWNDTHPDTNNPYFLLTSRQMLPSHSFDTSVYSPRSYENAYQASMRAQENNITLQIGSSSMRIGDRSIPIDPASPNTKALLLDNRTYVPIRAIIEAVGGTIRWDGKSRQVTINYRNYILDLWIDDPIAIVNGRNQRLEVPARIINNRTMVPLRFVAELLGMDVEWTASSRTVTVRPY